MCDIILYTWFGKKWKRLKKFWDWGIWLVYAYCLKNLRLSMLISFIRIKEYNYKICWPFNAWWWSFSWHQQLKSWHILVQYCIWYRNQSFVLLWKTNDWFLRETQHWVEKGYVAHFIKLLTLTEIPFTLTSFNAKVAII